VFISGLHACLSYGSYGPRTVLLLDVCARAVESAQNCIQCGECEGKCSYHLPIREMIEEKENMEFYRSIAQGAAEPTRVSDLGGLGMMVAREQVRYS